MLENMTLPDDLKGLTQEETLQLCGELRKKLLETVSHTGGHLASNLGAVELTVALHRVFNSPSDRMIFDVGHQSYIHKMLTGRGDKLETLRAYGGLSGFTRRSESEHDPFGCGHASTSLSAAVGMATADKLAGKTNKVIAVIGDGAFTGGMIYEALNNCAKLDNLIIVLNDNEMSISKNVGGISTYFSSFRTSARYFKFKSGFKKIFGGIPLVGKGLVAFGRGLRNLAKRLLVSRNLFEMLGLKYYGPLDGNDEKHLEIVLREAAKSSKCCVIHACTVKGKGYAPAEKDPDRFHGISGFDLDSGKIKNGKAKSFSERFGEIMVAAAAEDKKLCAITAAMEDGTGLCEFEKQFPERFFDVGIAEEHAVTFAAGLAASGLHPVFAVYSTFSQRCFDQIVHDCALQRLPVLLALDRAGFVGPDGPTHHGLFDVSMLLPVPGIRIYAAESFDDLEYAMGEALSFEILSAVRYTKGAPEDYDRGIFTQVGGMYYRDFGKTPGAAIITYGGLTKTVLLAALELLQSGVSVRVIKLVRLKPLDLKGIETLIYGIDAILFAEEGIKCGGAGEMTEVALSESGLLFGKSFEVRAVDDIFVPHGDRESLLHHCGLDEKQLAQALRELISRTDREETGV